MVENAVQIKSGIMVNVSVKIKKNHRVCKKDYIWNPTTCSSKNGKYLANIIDDSEITCHEIIEETKTIPKNFNEKKAKKSKNCKNFYISLTFLLITLALLIAVSIYYYYYINKYIFYINKYIVNMESNVYFK